MRYEALMGALLLLLLAAAPLAAQTLPEAEDALQQELERERRKVLEDVSWEAEGDLDFTPLSGKPSPAVPGADPFPLFGGRDLKLVRSSLDGAAKAAAPASSCDGALASYGVPSLNAVITAYVLEGELATMFDGRKSTMRPYSWKRTIAAYFRDDETRAGAIVLWGPSLAGRTSTFLGPYFFDPTHRMYIDDQRMVMVAHEAVHQFGGKGDAHFGGSKELSRLIIQKCFPYRRGRLGGIG